MTDKSAERETLWMEGTWSAAVTPRGALLLPQSVPEELVAGLWRLLRDEGGSLTAILDRLVMGTGGHLSRIPDFGLVILEKSGTHLALRGVPSLEIDGQGFDAAGVATWMESFIPGEANIVLAAPEEPGTVGRPVVDAVVRASRLELRVPTDADTADTAAAHTDHGSAAQAPAAEARAEATAPAAPPREPEERVAAPAAGQEAAPKAPNPAPEAAPEATAEAPAGTAAEPDTAELAPVQSVDRADVPGDHDGWTVADLPEELVDELGSMLPEPEPREEAPAEADTEVPDTEVTRMALSVICPSGHANPTNYVSCRECGAELTQPARIIACPPLGRVRVSSGGEVVLDRPVLIGREPSPERVNELNGAAPALITVPSPEQVISRNHLLIQLDEWSVLARSLSSSNGTVLRRDGVSPMRMSSTEPVLLRSGDILDLGDGQSLLLEDLP
ncbi:FHA domain-containing protein [Actinomyces sp. 565]|uniref:FHA domain-containing protein n=1 Tax=Actinomyces sp. 565 TaxID=2057794 RepID=UPI0031B87D50